MKSKLLFLALAISFTLSLTAQRLEIRVYPHLVTYDSGERLPTLEQLDTAKYVLNTIYNFHDIYFHYECPNIITSTAALSVQTNMCHLDQYFHDDGIDMFILPDGPINQPNVYYWPEVGFAHTIPGTAFYVSGVNTLNISCRYNNNLGGTLNGGNPFTPAYLSNALDGASRNGIVAHEMGHCLGLYHTFQNSGGNYCVPGTTFSSCPELVDGSNCTTCGDKVCDTAADPLGFDCCEYVGTAVDANGDTYDPDPNNVMTYGQGFCRWRLTRGQAQRIRSEMQGRPEVYTGPQPETCDFSLCCDYNRKEVCLMDKTCQLYLGDYCSSNECVYEWISPPLGFNGPACVPFDPNTHYIVKIYRGTSFKVINLTPNQYCKGPYFGIRSSDAELEVELFPNPVTEVINVKGEVSDASYQIFNLQGKYQDSGTIQDQKIDVNALTTGVYFVTIVDHVTGQYKVEKVIKI